METILLGIFIAGYLLITLEHSLKIDKLIPALGMMAILWAIIAIFNIPVFEVDTALRELIPVKVKKINVKIPKGTEPKDLTREDCISLWENQPVKKPRNKKKK